MFFLNASVQKERVEAQRKRTHAQLTRPKKRDRMKGKAKGFHSSGPFYSGESGIPKGLVLGRGQGAAPLAEHETESRNPPTRAPLEPLLFVPDSDGESAFGTFVDTAETLYTLGRVDDAEVRGESAGADPFALPA
ncbi:hypothetical protein SAMN02745702_00829 [Desulfobaculum bizertense DSM 18034]|uniref:Uncharacterized protein n=1 Tax=Desulfobaculum bizertense DSM 18034 TaxID=1121442 RepID=A0A1T4VRI1_9BACT|nr:hypothetical protein SAMN02745702_00829 [Desulfobaculum bizertense DSM 18034]